MRASYELACIFALEDHLKLDNRIQYPIYKIRSICTAASGRQHGCGH